MGLLYACWGIFASVYIRSFLLYIRTRENANLYKIKSFFLNNHTNKEENRTASVVVSLQYQSNNDNTLKKLNLRKIKKYSYSESSSYPSYQLWLYKNSVVSLILCIVCVGRFFFKKKIIKNSFSFIKFEKCSTTRILSVSLV